MSVQDLFFHSTQSRIAAAAFLFIFILISLMLLYTNFPKLPAAFITLGLVPIAAISLFQINCLITGNDESNYNLCGAYAWAVTALIALYSLILSYWFISVIWFGKMKYKKVRF